MLNHIVDKKTKLSKQKKKIFQDGAQVGYKRLQAAKRLIAAAK
jgi:hypothetical protein